MNVERPDQEVSLSSVLYQGKKSPVMLGNNTIQHMIGNNKIIVDSIYREYRSFLMDRSAKVKLTDLEFSKYKYNPKKLSLDLYQTMELWFILLQLNDMRHFIDFTKKVIYIIHPQYIDVVSDVINNNSDRLKKNQLNVTNPDFNF